LDLPHKPTGAKDAANAQRFLGITAVAMANGVYQGFLEAQVQQVPVGARDRLHEQLDQRLQLQGGGADEITPTPPG
jgi:hypothetical protein